MEVELKDFAIGFEAETLDNGLRVIVHEDHAAPIVAVHVMYGVGSRDEHRGRTGLAHLLEHLLFEGSANCPKGEFDRLLENVGGTNNGSTWFDRTNYYEVVPSHAVELALWLERERMAHFLPVLDGEMLDVQRSVVINERKQVYENRPYGLAYERLNELLFPADHPYSWPTIGYTPDLEAVTLDEARRFYERYYSPNNAVLVLAGDVTFEQGVEWATRYFGDLERGPDVGHGIPTTVGGIRGNAGTETLYDRVSFPRVYYAWSVPPYGSGDWIALDVLSYLLSDGESSRLQRSLVREKELVQQVDSYLYPTASAGIFGLVATARSGIGSDQICGAIDAVIEGLEMDLTEEEVVGAIRQARRDQLNGLATVEGRAEELAYAATVLGDAGRVNEIMNAYADVTPERVIEVARRYLSPEYRSVVIVEPQTTEVAA